VSLILEQKITTKKTKPLPISPTIEARENVSNIPKKIITNNGIFDSLKKTELD
jgi:hypothetical protein